MIKNLQKYIKTLVRAKKKAKWPTSRSQACSQPQCPRPIPRLYRAQTPLNATDVERRVEADRYPPIITGFGKAGELWHHEG